ncbi:MAG: glycosyltransferase family 2 protein [Pseudomonadales bacterium]
MGNNYSGSDVVFIVPTKDRPKKIMDLLDSLAIQTVNFSRLIIVDGGESIRNVVMAYADRLPVEYFQCLPPGQIRQRNMALSKLDNRTNLVGYLDDDLVLEPQALEEMLNCWNNHEENTAGISFNITNAPPFKHSSLRSLMKMSSPVQGRILKSGYNVPISPTDKDIRSQWLCGGATVWRQDLLLENAYKEVKSSWAICEDIMFSYPIGKHYPMYVAAKSGVRHEHVYDHKSKMKHKYYGRTATLWRLFFVESHAELSRVSFCWMISCQIVAHVCMGLVKLKQEEIQYALGQIEGLLVGLTSIYRGKGVLATLEV